MQEIIAYLRDKKLILPRGLFFFLAKLILAGKRLASREFLDESGEERMGGRCAGVACKKTPHKPLIFLLHWIPLLDTFSLHALLPLVLHHEFLEMGTSSCVLATAMVGSVSDAHAGNSCSCSSLLLLSYFC